MDLGLGRREIPALSALSALRFFAAVAIVFFHSGGHLMRVNNPLVDGAGLASLMVFFHVLSGFTLASIYPQLRERRATFRFWLARIGRIWPLHILLLALIVIAYASVIPIQQVHDAVWWWRLATNATLTQSWFPIFGAPRSYNAPAWTLSTEFALYLVFPFLIGRWRRIWVWALPVFFLLALSVTGYASYAAGHQESFFHRLGIIPGEVVYLHPSVRLLEFAVGMTLATFRENISERHRAGVGLSSVLEICVVALAVAVMCGSGSVTHLLARNFDLGPVWTLWISRMLLPLVPFASLILMFSLHRGAFSRALSARWLLAFGALSYTIYLVHSPVIWLCAGAIGNVVPVWARVALFWCCLLAVAHFFYNVWELPCRKFFRTLLPRRGVQADRIKSVNSAPRIERWLVGAAEMAILVALISVQRWEEHFPIRQRVVSEAEGHQLASAGLPNLRDVHFGNRFALEGIVYRWNDSALELQLVWRSLQNQRLDNVEAVHFIGRDGKLLGGADHLQEPNERPVAGNDCWVETVRLEQEQLRDTASIGLGIYRKGQSMFPIDSGKRDWSGARLLIDLAADLPRRRPAHPGRSL